MAIEFKVFQSTSNLVSEGSVLDLVGAKGTISRIPKNWNNPEKRVVLLLTREDGTSAAVSCSEAVSKMLRSKEITIEHVLGFQILTTESGVPFISAPATALQTVKVADLVVKAFQPKEVAWEQLIG